MVFIFGSPDDHKRFAEQGIATLLLAGNIGAYRYSGDYFYPNPNPLIHTWSLSVEVQIYIFLPLFLLLALYGRKNIKNITETLLALITMASFISFQFPQVLQPIYSRAGIQMADQFSFYSPFDRIWQFTLGGLGFLILDRYQKQIRKISRQSHYILPMILIITLFGPINISVRTSSTLVSFIALAVIVMRSLDFFPKYLCKKLEWLGYRSYSIYLIHMPLIYVAKYSLATQIGSWESRIIQTIIAVIAAIVTGSLIYSKIENRYRVVSAKKVIGTKSIFATFLLIFIIPISLFLVIEKGGKQKYWGLNRNLSIPIDAGSLDPKCNRDVLGGPPCIYAKTGATKTVLLIGDSHARHISQAVIDSARNQNWNSAIWTLSGCHFQLKVTRPNEVPEGCISRNLEIISWIKTNKIDSLIVSQYVYADSTEKHLKNALLTIRSIVPSVLLVENNPVFPDKKDFMVQRPLVMPPYNPPKEFARSMMDLKDKKASDELANWSRQNGISTMNLDKLFCDEKSCKRFSDAGWLYRDIDHFSVAGAVLAIPQLSSFLQNQ